LASLSVTIIDMGPHDARQNTIGMVVGAVALVVFCVVAYRQLTPQHHDREIQHD